MIESFAIKKCETKNIFPNYLIISLKNICKPNFFGIIFQIWFCAKSVAFCS